MKKKLPYVFKALKIFLITVVALYAIAYAYITINKDKIIKQVTTQVSDKLNGKLEIKDAEISLFRTFPKISVLLKDITLIDTMFAQHKHPFFAAKEVFVSLNIYKLIKKDQPLTGLRLDNGSIYMYTDTSGYTNTYLMKSKKDPAGGPKKTSDDINLKTIKLNNIRIILNDLKREKLHDFDVKRLTVKLDDGDTALTLKNDADILVNSLAFNLDKGIFLKGATFRGDFKMNYGKVSQLLSFNDIDVQIAGKPYNLSGKFDLGEKNPGFSLGVRVKKAMYEDVKKVLPRRIDSSLSIVSLNKPLDAEAELHGPLRGGEPFISVKWNVKNSRLVTPFLDFDDASFTGFYNNEVVKGLPRTDPNSIISISNFKAEWHGLPVSSNKIQILNLLVPELICDLRSSFPLTALNDVIQTNSLQLNSGNGDIVLNYKGPIQQNNNTNSFLNGYISFKNGTVLYAPRNVELKNVNGAILFQNSDVVIQNVQFTALDNKIVMNGNGKNLLTLINTDPDKVTINYNIYSPQLNLGSFTYLLRKNKGVAAAPKKSNKSFGTVAVKLDRMLAQSIINVSLNAGKLLYKKFSADNVAASVTLLQDRYVINNASMSVAGGSMALNGQLVNSSGPYHTAAVNVGLNNVDVKRIFAAFENFGQDGILGENLEGNLTAKINTSVTINDAAGVMPSSAMGNVDFSLKNGALNNYEPIKKIQKFIFKKRDFENIRFAELKNKLEINKGEIKINRMEIQSSVLTLFVEGLYSKKGNTDISIQVPLNNLKKREEDYNPENLGTDKKGGRSVHLRGRPGPDGKIAFKLDLFNKFDKEKAPYKTTSPGKASDSTAGKTTVPEKARKKGLRGLFKRN